MNGEWKNGEWKRRVEAAVTNGAPRGKVRRPGLGVFYFSRFPFHLPASRTHSMPTFLTRRVTFAAAHRYCRPDWSDEQNERVFGACARPSFHGHGYTCDITVTGEVDRNTGMVIDLGLLDRVIATEVRERFDHRNINVDVPEFGDGRLIPTGEELALFILERVQQGIGDAARVVSVTVAEDSTLSATYRAE